MYPIFTCATAGHIELAINLQASAHRLGVKIHCHDLPGTSADYGTASFAHVTLDKLRLLIYLTQTHPRFLFIDADCVLAALPWVENQPAPLLAQSDLCTGVLLCTPACEPLFQRALGRFKRQLRQRRYVDDQEAIQYAARVLQFPWEPLPRDQWLDGSQSWPSPSDLHQPVLLHANFVVGVEAKKQKLIEAGRWYL